MDMETIKKKLLGPIESEKTFIDKLNVVCNTPNVFGKITSLVNIVQLVLEDLLSVSECLKAHHVEESEYELIIYIMNKLFPKFEFYIVNDVLYSKPTNKQKCVYKLIDDKGNIREYFTEDRLQDKEKSCNLYNHNKTEFEPKWHYVEIPFMDFLIEMANKTLVESKEI